jgi:hypothetical protein
MNNKMTTMLVVVVVVDVLRPNVQIGMLLHFLVEMVAFLEVYDSKPSPKTGYTEVLRALPKFLHENQE